MASGATHAARAFEHLRAHWVRWALGLGCLFNALVVWSATWLPMGDVGGHLELMDVMARAGDPTTLFPAVYDVGSPWTANGLGLVLNNFFHGLLGTIGTAKLMITWYVVGVPLGLHAIARAFGRPEWTALFGVPLVFGALFNVGFLNFLAALPFLLFGVALARRFAVEGGAARGALLWVVLSLTFFAHVIGYLVAIGVATFVLLLFLPGPRRWPRLLPLLASAPALAAWVFERFVAGRGTETGRTFLSDEGGLGAVFMPLDRRLEDMHAWGMRFFKDDADEVAFLAMVFVWLAAMAAAAYVVRDDRARSAVAPAPRPDDRAHDRIVDGWGRLEPALTVVRGAALELLALGSLLAYFVLPNHLHEVEIIAERTWFVALCFFALWPRVRPTSPGRIAIIAPLVVVALVYPWVVRAKVERFERDYLGDLPEVIAALPDKTALAYVMGYPEIDLTHMGPLWHIPKALQAIENGGYTDDSFAKRPYYPIQYKPGTTPPRLSQAFWRDGNLLEYDYVLTLQRSPPTAALAREEALSLLWHQGDWWLFEVVERHRFKRNLPRAGGTGGVAHWDTCRPDERWVGLAGYTDTETITALSVLCEQPGQDAARPRHLPSRGRHEPGHRAFERRCRPGEIVTGVEGREEGLIRGITVHCGAADAPSELPAGGTAGAPFALTCPSGEHPIGLKIRSGWFVDGVGLLCHADDVKDGQGAHGAPSED